MTRRATQPAEVNTGRMGTFDRDTDPHSASEPDESEIDGIDLRGADLSGLDLSGADLTSVRWDSETTWPSPLQEVVDDLEEQVQKYKQDLEIERTQRTKAAKEAAVAEKNSRNRINELTARIIAEATRGDEASAVAAALSDEVDDLQARLKSAELKTELLEARLAAQAELTALYRDAVETFRPAGGQPPIG